MPQPTYPQAVVAVYRNAGDAHEAVTMLQQNGIPVGNVSVVIRDPQQAASDDALHARTVTRESDSERASQGEGERFGAVLGGLGGLLVGTASLLLPELGLVILLGPLAGMVTGAGLGAMVGDAGGAMHFADDAADYRTHLAQGHILVVVHAETNMEERARDILLGSHYTDIEVRPFTLRPSDTKAPTESAPAAP